MAAGGFSPGQDRKAGREGVAHVQESVGDGSEASAPEGRGSSGGMAGHQDPATGLPTA